MDLIERVLIALPKVHGARPERIGRPTRDAEATLQLAQLAAKVGPALDHLLGGYQSGHSCLSWIVAVPDQAKPSFPTPTP